MEYPSPKLHASDPVGGFTSFVAAPAGEEKHFPKKSATAAQMIRKPTSMPFEKGSPNAKTPIRKTIVGLTY